jgi:hypothetical protein
MALGAYWGGIVYAIDVITVISAVGAIGGLPALLNALTKYTRLATRRLQGLQWRSGASVSRSPQRCESCNRNS